MENNYQNNGQEPNYQNQGYQQPGYQQPGYQQPGYQQTVPAPSSHMVGAILATLFCCLPFGIAAIVNAARVDKLWYSGDQAGALEASNKAHKWMVTAIVLGLISNVLYIIYMVVAGGAAMMMGL